MYDSTPTTPAAQTATSGPRRLIAAAAITLAATTAVGLGSPLWVAGTVPASHDGVSVSALRYPHNGSVRSDERRRPHRPPQGCLSPTLCLPRNGG